jgi:anti-anti-sigma factor
MTDGGWAVWPDTAVLMLAASQGPDEDDGLTVLVRHEPGYVLVTVAGEVDFASAAGLGALAGAARHATAHGGSLRVVCGRRQIRRLFGLTRLDQAVPLAASLAEILLQAAEAGAEAV